MKKNDPIFLFPFDQFRKASQQLAQERKMIKAEQEKWQQVRSKVPPKQQAILDAEFKITFEQFQPFFYKITPFEDTAFLLLEKLKQLAEKGASGILLDPYELGGFNTAGVAKELPELNSEKQLDLASELIRICITTGADLSQLKAYVGNGGVPTLYWLCEYLARGIGQEWNQLKNERQYKTTFRIFCWLLAGSPETSKVENYAAIFLERLKPDKQVHEFQLEAYFRLVRSGLVKMPPEHYISMFSGVGKFIKSNAYQWIPVLFPFEEKENGFYVFFLRECMQDSGGRNLLNGFKVNKEGRKYFSNYFNYQRHWLLTHILQHDPESIFGLVRGHEIELLEPFLKHYKKELVELRDKKGNTLLHAAVLSRNSPERIISRLIDIGLSKNV